MKVNSMAIAKHINFKGYVQGVGFRFTANSVAKRYELTGFVRNKDDGGVEMLVQGDPQDIDDCIEDLKETFTVRDLEIEEVPVNTSYDNFRITF
ncbi:MAG: hypothetical protein A2Y10_09305 [Planctomycetes bacterium GWF2_41_51]|nr:MAG: hypothetical protein A2Y10_09305 [Planctomycetes bacterium GWF2_41_51]